VSVGSYIAAEAIAFYTGAYRSALAILGRARYALERLRRRFPTASNRELDVIARESLRAQQAANRLNQSRDGYRLTNDAVPDFSDYQRQLGQRGGTVWRIEAVIEIEIADQNGNVKTDSIRRAIDAPLGSSRREIEDLLSDVGDVPDAIRGLNFSNYASPFSSIEVKGITFWSVSRIIP
jgi:hypothetical protein